VALLIEKSNIPAEYLEFERNGWGAFIGGYNDTFGAVTRQTAQVTLNAARRRAAAASKPRRPAAILEIYGLRCGGLNLLAATKRPGPWGM
jgi:hypothetical protein